MPHTVNSSSKEKNRQKNDDQLENESTHSDEENSVCEKNQSEYCGWVDQSDKHQQDYEEEKSEENDHNFYEASNNSDQDTLERNDVNF